MAESAAVLGAADPLAGQLMLLHGSADVLEKTANTVNKDNKTTCYWLTDAGQAEFLRRLGVDSDRPSSVG